MKTRISVQERLKDLRVEQGLNLEELAQETGISKSALGSYENDNDEYKEINHGSLLKLDHDELAGTVISQYGQIRLRGKKAAEGMSE